MPQYTYTLVENDLSKLTTLIAGSLRPGDIITLWGDLGAGKTTFARALIHALIDKPVDVPSPTFTLVQAYETSQGEVWHCDLYRLKAPEEIAELGLIDAFHHAICLVEWPERLGSLIPQRRIDIALRIVDETTREITINLVGTHDALRSVLETPTR